MLYFVGACLSFMEADFGAEKVASWLPVSNTLAITAVSPFVGYLQDLLGRRNITLAGSIIIMVGIALIGSAKSFGQAVTGMTLSGAGAGICELTALAGYRETHMDITIRIADRGQIVGHRACAPAGHCPGPHDRLHHPIHAIRYV